jgi:hypothetical protein
MFEALGKSNIGIVFTLFGLILPGLSSEDAAAPAQKTQPSSVRNLKPDGETRFRTKFFEVSIPFAKTQELENGGQRKEQRDELSGDYSCTLYLVPTEWHHAIRVRLKGWEGVNNVEQAHEHWTQGRMRDTVQVVGQVPNSYFKPGTKSRATLLHFTPPDAVLVYFTKEIPDFGCVVGIVDVNPRADRKELMELSAKIIDSVNFIGPKNQK